MERKPGARQIASDDRDWWTAVDEGYWQALLADGEIASETVLPSGHAESLPTQRIEIEAHEPEGQPAIVGHSDLDSGELSKNKSQILPENRDHIVQSSTRTKPEDGWQVAQLALDRGDSFCLKVSGSNRGGLLVSWNGLQGFVPASHLTDLSHHLEPDGRLAELSRRIGDSLIVRLIEVDAHENRLVFSERAAMSDPRSSDLVLSTLHPGDVCKGTVTNLTTFGAFVDLGGVEGLIHISEISWDRVQHPSDVLHPGQDVEVYVLGVKPEEKRIALSLKRLRPDPWDELESRYYNGQIVEGTVTNVVNFGAFVRIEEGLEGLVHISELADGHFLHPRNIVSEGDAVRVRVLNIDAKKHRLGLSLRQVRTAEPLSKMGP